MVLLAKVANDRVIVVEADWSMGGLLGGFFNGLPGTYGTYESDESHLSHRSQAINVDALTPCANPATC